MSEVFTLKEMLYKELDLAVRTTRGLLSKIKSDQWEYRPRENMRTLQELAHHLVLVPITDLAILQEKSQEEVAQYYREIEHLRDGEELGRLMEKGSAALKAYMDGLSEEDFLHKKTTAFYMEYGTEQAKWLIEIVTHIFHHRSQLFTYLKQLGHEVNMFDLY